MNEISFNDISIWKKHVTNVLEVFVLSLDMLKSKNMSDAEEEDLNFELYIIAEKEVNKGLLAKKNNQGIRSKIEFESPKPDYKEKNYQKWKRPDFTIGFRDMTTFDVIDFHIECKIIKTGRNKGASHCREYVLNGVRRFVTKDHSYGINAADGAMIGYIQSMEFEDILIKINHCNSKNNYNSIDPPSVKWNAENVNRLTQILERKIEKSPFNLYHLWIDLRK